MTNHRREALRDVLRERGRQIAQGWTPEHDAKHLDGELAPPAAPQPAPVPALAPEDVAEAAIVLLDEARIRGETDGDGDEGDGAALLRVAAWLEAHAAAKEGA